MWYGKYMVKVNNGRRVVGGAPLRVKNTVMTVHTDGISDTNSITKSTQTVFPNKSPYEFNDDSVHKWYIVAH